jgi:3-hydroxyisobutyrate dehydrogenase
MGLPMARALLAAGFDVWGLDVRPATEFGDFAPRMLAPDAFAARCRTVLSVVRDAPQTEALLFDDQAILRRSGAIDTLLICSTVSPRWLATLPPRVPAGLALVDAPMSGAPIAAQEARLSYMLGGEPAVLDNIAPLIAATGRVAHRMGPFGAGMTAKVLNNFVAASSVVAVRQALVWADGLGVERERLMAVLHDSSGQTWFGSNFDRIAFAREGHAPSNTIGIIEKDVRACLDATGADLEAGFPAAVIAGLRALGPDRGG